MPTARRGERTWAVAAEPAASTGWRSYSAHLSCTVAVAPSLRARRLTLALSSDGGTDFGAAFALYNSTVPKRFCGSAKPYGPSYPQARQVAGAGIALDGLWTVYSINKEDIGVTFAPNASVGLKRT